MYVLHVMHCHNFHLKFPFSAFRYNFVFITELQKVNFFRDFLSFSMY